MAKPSIRAAGITLQQVGLQGPNSVKSILELGAAFWIIPLLVILDAGFMTAHRIRKQLKLLASQQQQGQRLLT
ncbi:MAG: hypothetical protein ACYCZR_10250 [Burkholderiales bacterium]